MQMKITKLARGVAVAALATAALATPAGAAPAKQSCATIGSGSIKNSDGTTVTAGFDKYGYNYQAHLFNGTYDSSDRVLDGMYGGTHDYDEYADDSLIMKWSDP